MADLKSRWLSLIDEYLADSPATIPIEEQVQPIMMTEPPIGSAVVVPEEQVDDLPIYEATPKEINYWHAFGSNVFLQNLLRQYDLDFSSENVQVYNYFKIGFDEKTHRATFAIDDTHYYAIAFDNYNASPLSSSDARKVLLKVNQIFDEL